MHRALTFGVAALDLRVRTALLLGGGEPGNEGWSEAVRRNRTPGEADGGCLGELQPPTPTPVPRPVLLLVGMAVLIPQEDM